MTAGADEGAMSPTVVTVVPAHTGLSPWESRMPGMMTTQLAAESTEELMDL